MILNPTLRMRTIGNAAEKRLAMIKKTAKRFWLDETAEILEKAGIIAAVSVAIIALIALGAMAASALQNASGWFG